MAETRYSVIILKMNNPQNKYMVARYLVGVGSMNLKEALSLLGKLPVSVLSGKTLDEAHEAMVLLQRFGVDCRIGKSGQEINATAGKDLVSMEMKIRENIYIPDPSLASVPALAPAKGVRESIIIESEIIEQKPQSLKIPWVRIGIGLLLLLFAGCAIWFFLKGRPGFSMSAFSLNPAGKKPAIRNLKGSRDSGKPLPSADTIRSTIDSVKSQKFLDSARSMGIHYEKAVVFYKIAIGFNPRNIEAWRGLIGAYRNGGNIKEAEEAETAMNALLDSSQVSPQAIVKPYGILVSYTYDKTGTVHLQYRSFAKTEQLLNREAFAIARALLVQSPCTTLYLFSETEKGKGLLVTLPGNRIPVTLEEFGLSAVVTYIE